MLNNSDIAFLSATELVKQISSEQVSLPNAIAAVRKRIDETNSTVNAFDSFADVIKPQCEGPLGGLPISIKDQIHVAGMSCNFGLDKAIPGLSEKTSSPIANLLGAGASIIGKTSLPPYAMDFQTFNARTGWTNNPWDTAYTAGGSSGGGAAAVASGMSFLDIGADLAGSLRIPAAFCGVFSFLPTEGALASDGMLAGEGVLPRFARMGPIARNVDDLMLAWKFLSGTESSGSANEKIQLAYWEPGRDELVEERIVSAFSTTRELFANAGIETKTTRADHIINDDSYRCYGEIMGYETGKLLPPLARWLGRLFGRSAAQRSPRFLKHVHSGQQCNANRYENALKERVQIQSSFDGLFAGADALLLPVSRVSAFKHRKPTSDRNSVRDYQEPFSIGDGEMGYLDAITSFTTPISLIGNPVVTIPLGLDERGLPIGAQLIGARGKDWELLKLAKQLALVLPAVTLAKSD